MSCGSYQKSISFTTTDTEILTKETLPYKSKEEFNVVFNTVLLEKLCQKLPDMIITLDIETNTKDKIFSGSVKISSIHGEYEIPITYPATDFPNIDTVNYKHSFIAEDAESLQRLIRKVAFATAPDVLQVVLNGVYLHSEGKKIVAMASDKMIITTISDKFKDVPKDFGVIITKAGVNIIKDYSATGEIKVKYNKRNINLRL